MTLPGISGLLLPARFLAEQVAPAARCDLRTLPQWERWWREVARTCGPATGVRTLFDVAAMPLFGRLGFRARHPRFQPGSATAVLHTPRGQPIALLVRPWAEHPPGLWREATSASRESGASWCCVFAPPTLSIIPAAGHAIRRSLDFTWPAAIEPGSLGVLLSLARAESFDAEALGRWLRAAMAEQAQVRSDLQLGVMEALTEFASVLPHRTGDTDDEALTLAYRILFLLFAESRDLVPRHHPVYRESYTLTSLCDDVLRTQRVQGLWDSLAAISRLSRMGGRVDSLEVFPFNGHLFSSQAAPTLESVRGRGRRSPASSARDAAVGRALVALGTRREPAGRVVISYADLGVEELGAIYERVLDVDRTTTHAVPVSRHSARRKDTGTFYTPQALADFVVQRTLAPLVEGQSAERLLSLRIVDPAMGSGAFLVAALRYLSIAYERALIDEGRCQASDVSDGTRAEFRRLIAHRCLYGVDANPVAVQLARLSIWLATLAHTRPLGFLDHRLRTGNSLIGATPADIQRSGGAHARELPLFDAMHSRLEVMLRRVVPACVELGTLPDDSVSDVRRKETAWAALREDSHPLARWRLAVSLWCAQWLWPEGDRAPSSAEVRAGADAIVRGHGQLGAGDVDRLATTARSVARTHACFHWPLEFPDVFFSQLDRPHEGGFDAVIGNPPWEVVRRDRASGRTGIGRDPIVTFVRESGLYPMCRSGHLNLYQPFVERSLSLVRRGGRVGLIVPWGFAVDDGAATMRSALVDAGALDTIVGFENSRGLFPIHRGTRFAVVVATPGDTPRDIKARFGVSSVDAIEAMTASDHVPLPLQLDAGLVTAVGGPTRRIPDVRGPDDLQWLASIMRAHPAFGSPHGWHAQFSRELNATDDRHVFTKARAHALPVLDGKHIAPFVAPTTPTERFVPESIARRRFADGRYARPRLAYRDVSAVGNQFALIAAVIPAHVVTTHTLFCLRNALTLEHQHFLCGILNSNLMNRVVRLLMGSHVTTSLMRQLPVPRWAPTSVHRRIAAAAAQLAHQDSPESARDRVRARLNADVASLYEPAPENESK